MKPNNMDTDEYPVVASQIEEHSDQIGDLIDHVVRRVGIFVLGYVVLDTARQMLIASARKR